MRLWHIDLLPILPKAQLVAQWRELSAIAGAIQKNGTPNHILVNFVTEYPYDHFINYAQYVREVMTIRGYRTMESVWDKIVALKPDWKLMPIKEVYEDKMNETYYTICFWNLYEKILCGGIKEPDSSNIIKAAIKRYEKGDNHWIRNIIC